MDTGNNARWAANLPVPRSARRVASAAASTAVRGCLPTTRSGTNQFRWSVFQSGRNSSLSSNSWAASQNGARQSVSRSAAFGFTLGGPVGRPGGDNQLFFFYSQELRPSIGGRNTNYFRLPTERERRGDFSETVDQNGKLENRLYDAASGLPKSACSATDTTACFQDGGVLGRIPLSRLYGPGLALLNQYPLPNAAPADGRSYNYSIATPIQFTLTYTPMVRLDYVPAPHTRLAGIRWARTRSSNTAGSLPGFNDTLQNFRWRSARRARSRARAVGRYSSPQNRLGAPPVSDYEP